MNLSTYTIIASICLSTVGVVSCNKASDEAEVIKNEQTANDDFEFSSLESALLNAVSSPEEAGEAYIIYDAESGKYLLFDSVGYHLALAFANLVARDGNSHSTDDSLSDEAWTTGRSGKGKTDAVRLSKDLMKSIPKGQNLEFHVAYNEDGSFTINYRPFKNTTAK